MKVNYVFLSIFLIFNSCISLKVGNKDVKTNNSTSNFNTIEFINSQENIDREYPFSEATVVNGIIFLSGEIGTLTDGTLIDGGIEGKKHPRTSSSIEDSLLDPDAIADTYLHVYDQPRSAWTWEVELRPWVEVF